MKKGTTVMPSWAKVGMQIFNDLDQMVIDDAINILTILDENLVSPIMGKSQWAHTGLMTDIRRMLVLLGWTNQNADLLPRGLNLSPDPIEPQSPAQWKAAVMKKCAEILEERAHHLPPNIDSGAASGCPTQFIPNDVCVVDKSYMTHSFHSQEWQQTTDAIGEAQADS